MRRAAVFEKIVALAKEHGIWVVHDLATPTSVSTATRRRRIMQVPGAKDVPSKFFTMSKSYNMAGWRVGFMVGNPHLVGARAASRANDYGTFTPIPGGIIAAWKARRIAWKKFAK